MYRAQGDVIRPFSAAAEVRCRGYSTILQRIITDFGADKSFQQINRKLKEHYGIEVPTSSSQGITERHAQRLHDSMEVKTEVPESKGKEVLIGEADGSMIPVVETTEAPDRRKSRQVSWQEARLCMVREPGKVEGRFAATMGSPDEAGQQWLAAAIKEGMGSATRIHGVGDGATWIAEQVDRVFGTQGRYLIDFYHLCDYLSAAAEVLSPADKTTWMEQQKSLLKEGRLDEVMETLRKQLDKETPSAEDDPVWACYSYIKRRPGQFEYKRAIDAGLPIGSGEIESGHRHVLQQRLKLSGAWWKPANAEYMIALRVVRANNEWEHYWQKAA